MREIKFRAFSEKRGMIDLNEGCRGGNATIIMWPVMKACEYKDQKQVNLPLMQYTGLKDKNGVEIYEGDIIEHRDGYPQTMSRKVVKFEKGAFVYCGSFDSGGATTYHPYVIGNIHETPELLK